MNSYSNDIASPEVEIANEAGGNFFADSKSRHADLRSMLDSSKDNLKLEAMKRIINMVARGKDASDMFPAVVKNVAAKNHEVKKLVYVYLVRYAEEQQDLALLSISTFQRGLKDPNQLIRASALRVLSSIRVPMIVPIMMLAIRESMRDMSSYVRKTAAHAIPKLYSLDPELKDQMIEIIDHLLSDKTTLVIGSAVYAFEEVCPERIDLIHKHYRKLCQLLADVDEWGQVIIINMLTRYARTQFTDPNQGDEENPIQNEKFYSSEEESDAEEEEVKPETENKKPYAMDPDLRTLLRNAKPLLQSRSSGVVLAVAQLYYHLAPTNETVIIARALIRLLRGPREVQLVVLNNIATVSAKRRNMFEPFLKSFFVRSSDSTQIKLLKIHVRLDLVLLGSAKSNAALEILTNLATQSNISVILREFQTYVVTHDREFASATIDAIGRCASNIKEVTDVCLSGLVNLMSNKNETVVGQSVVVIKKLLQMQPAQHSDIIVQMAKLFDKIQIPAARASILWLIGEYCDRVPKIAPDVFRKAAKNFADEDEVVKMQVLNLGIKLLLMNPEQTQAIVQYVFSLARYDQSYDLRDRARFLRAMVMPQKEHKFFKFASKIFLTQKPAPVIESRFKDRDQFQLSTLSHLLNQRCIGYHDLPQFPDVPPDASVRNVQSFPEPQTENKPTPAKKVQSTPTKHTTKENAFYSDEEEQEGESAEGEETSEEDEEESEEEEGEEDGGDEEEEEEEEDEEESEESGEETSSESSEEKPVAKTKAPVKAQAKPKPPPSKNTDLLVDLFDSPVQGSTTTMMPMTAQPMLISTPVGTLKAENADASSKLIGSVPVAVESEVLPAQFIPSVTHELVNRLVGHGMVISYRFSRSPNLFSSRACSVELQFTNVSDKPIKSIKIASKKLQPGMDLSEFPEIAELSSGQSYSVVLPIDFGDTTQTAHFELAVGDLKHNCSIQAPVGEQLQPLKMSPLMFAQIQKKLSGLNETSGSFPIKAPYSLEDPKSIFQKMYELANVVHLPEISDKVAFAAQTLSSKVPLLITFSKKSNEEVRLAVNCEKMVIGSMLFKELKKNFST